MKRRIRISSSNYLTRPSKYADTMVTKLAGGEVPDVMMLAMDQVPRYALNGMLLPLDDLASQEYKDALYPVVKERPDRERHRVRRGPRNVTPKGHVCSIPRCLKTPASRSPADTWTMDEFVEIAKQLTKGSGAGCPVGVITGQTGLTEPSP